MHLNNHADNRASPRYPLQWKVAVVFDDSDEQPTFHGITNEISLDGLSFYTDHNIYSVEAVTLLLAIPPMSQGARKKLIEIRGRMEYTVLAAGVDRFRIGVRFNSFKRDGKKLLASHLEDRAFRAG